MQNQQIILIHGKNHKQMTKQLLQAAGLADEIGSRDTPVALKPNLVIGAPASRGATTHPELVAGVLLGRQPDLGGRSDKRPAGRLPAVPGPVHRPAEGCLGQL